MSDHGQEAFVTLATNDSYAVGALVLAHSLRRVATTKRLVVMIMQGVSQSFREQLSSVFDVVTQVDVLDSHDSANLKLLTRPDLGVTFTKLHCWRLTQFTKCVFLDADTLVVQNIDDLFERDEFSAALDVGWPDCFNSGVFVYRPSNETYAALLHFAVTHGSSDGGDQGLLNLFFSDWATKDITRRLPFVYNVVSQAFYSYLPALKQYGRYGKNAKVLHFIGSVKPWHLKFNSGTGQVDLSGESSHYAEFLQLWWNLFLERVKPNVDLNVVTETEHLSQFSVFTKQQLDDGQRQYNRERGQIDYLGIDSFDNIQKQLDHKLSSSSSHQHPDPPKIQISSEKVETTYPNIDEHFHRSLGSDYSRVVNRVDVPASAAAFPAANVCQGGPVRSPTGTTAAVPAAVPRIDRLSQLDESYWAFDSGSTDGGLQAKESSVLFESLSESFLKNCKEVMLYLCQQQVAMKDLQRQLNEVKYQLDTDHCCRCTCHQASVGNIQLPSPIDNSSSDEDPGDERQQDVFSAEDRLQQTSPVVKAPNTIIDWKKIRGLPKLL